MTRTFLLASACLAVVLISNATGAEEMEWLHVSRDQSHFALEPSHRRFIPWGVNYDRDYKSRLLEDYWETEWATVEQDFREMKQLGANVVRIHLQLGKFMESQDRPNEKALVRLTQLVKLAEKTGLYLDLTGLGCYHRKNVPVWYDKLEEDGRWKVQARFWAAIAGKCATSPAIFCYDLMNEPVAPRTKSKDGDWLPGPPLGDKYFLQFITLDPKDRPRSEIAKQWVHALVEAIRRQDRRHMITVGLLPGSPERADDWSGFDLKELTDLDYISVHMYPESGQVDNALKILSRFSVGKPVVIEETFPLRCSIDEFKQFMNGSKQYASGWIGFYWGQTPEELRRLRDFSALFTLPWLEFFQKEAKNLANPR